MKSLRHQIEEAAEKDARTYALIGAAMEVHKHLGCGFLENVYREAYVIELLDRKILFGREVDLPIHYKQKRLQTVYRADFVCFETIIVEIKALSRISRIEEAQIINYLKATGFQTGLLLNFGAGSLQYRRFAFSKSA